MVSNLYPSVPIFTSSNMKELEIIIEKNTLKDDLILSSETLKVEVVTFRT